MNTLEKDKIRQAVRKTYADVATGVTDSCESGCGCDTVNLSAGDMSVNLGYTKDDVSGVPDGANMGLGCGNPQAIASLKAGETVLDLGSGGGFDCFLASRAVGDTGQVIGVDMTPEMISKARHNAVKADVNNVEFRLGEIEYLPLADHAVDVIISNCVINLSLDKTRTYQEAFRVLRKGGRLAISDVVITVPLPDSMLNDLKHYSACVSGAISVDEIRSILEEAGFTDIRIQSKDESRDFIREWIPGSKIEDYVLSATIEAIKP
ncbi:MAG TPA: arsenite methyltransferase [Spirochaetes bacterium]|nr:arsenite methyltransferase [Spirochaetota bacterium]